MIDGQQRLTSFFSFLDGNFPDGTEFKLTGLKVFSELNGKKYDGLSETLQDAIRYFKLRTVTLRRESDPNLKFEIFERLNTGSVSLNEQELRNCIYQRWSRFTGQNGGLAKVDSGFDYAANFSSFA